MWKCATAIIRVPFFAVVIVKVCVGVQLCFDPRHGVPSEKAARSFLVQVRELYDALSGGFEAKRLHPRAQHHRPRARKPPTQSRARFAEQEDGPLDGRRFRHDFGDDRIRRAEIGLSAERTRHSSPTRSIRLLLHLHRSPEH